MLTDFAEYGYAGLFLAAFLAATILPFSSEVVFSALVFGGLNAWICVLCATFGNWLGGITCYWLGRLGKIEWIEKWLHVARQNRTHTQMVRALWRLDIVLLVSAIRWRHHRRGCRIYALQLPDCIDSHACRQICTLFAVDVRTRIIVLNPDKKNLTKKIRPDYCIIQKENVHL